jgi:signal transduction histidine kinase
MPVRSIRPLCIVALVVAWVIDLFTPQLFVVAILFNAPIALSSLALDSRFTRFLVGLAFVANVVAGYVNGVHDGHHWDTIAIADRAISACSFLLVGSLSIATQRSAKHAGELLARQDRIAREGGVRRAIEAVRGSVNSELIRRALVREALAPLGADSAIFFAFDPTLDAPTTYRATRARPTEIEVSSDRPDAAILSFLHRVAERGERIVPIAETDALGRLLLATLGAPHAIAACAIEHGTIFGTLVLLRDDVPFETHFDEGLAAYVDQVAIALAQAKLFVRLAERNEALAVANGALRERGDVIRDIVYALSHDLRTPLAAARMTMVQARDGAFGALPAAYEEILDRSIASNDELERLAETLLLVSRYESGEAGSRRERVALAEIVRDVARELAPLWEHKGVRVTLDLDDAIEVDGDDREVRRAFVNLLANAIAWTPRARAIVISLRAREDRAEVRFDDEGYGVPQADVATLFERVRATPARRGAGSGLGLYLVRRIADAHAGSVVYAPRPGGGSTFLYTLPLAAQVVLR